MAYNIQGQPDSFMSLNKLIGRGLSYSAGRTNLDPYRFRVIQPRNKLASVLEAFPEIRGPFALSAPLVVNAYPAAIGDLSQAVLVDSYLRPSTVSRALDLAARENVTAVLIAQPLAAAHLLLEHRHRRRPLPNHLVVVVGGYPCPQSLQRFIERIFEGVLQPIIIHMYGVGELDAGVFAGIHRNTRGDVLYHLVERVFVPVIEDGRLAFERDGEGGLFVTDDYAEIADSAFVIRNHANRVDPRVLGILEAWSEDDWSRRTGYLACVNHRYVFQLRESAHVAMSDEQEHFDFCRAQGTSWLDKPVWSYGSRSDHQ